MDSYAHAHYVLLSLAPTAQITMAHCLLLLAYIAYALLKRIFELPVECNVHTNYN